MIPAAYFSDYSGWYRCENGRGYRLPMNEVIELTSDGTSVSGRSTFNIVTRGRVSIASTSLTVSILSNSEKTVLYLFGNDLDQRYEFECEKFDIFGYIEMLKKIKKRAPMSLEDPDRTERIPRDIPAYQENIDMLKMMIVNDDFSSIENDGLKLTDRITVSYKDDRLSAEFKGEELSLRMNDCRSTIYIDNDKDHCGTGKKYIVLRNDSFTELRIDL